MTVAELIAALQVLDPTLPVCIDSEGPDDIRMIRETTIARDVHEMGPGSRGTPHEIDQGDERVVVLGWWRLDDKGETQWPYGGQ